MKTMKNRRLVMILVLSLAVNTAALAVGGYNWYCGRHLASTALHPPDKMDHHFYQVDAGGQLGNRVLNLQTGIHLQEIEVALLIDDELYGAGGLVIHGPGQGHGLLTHFLAGSLIYKR